MKWRYTSLLMVLLLLPSAAYSLDTHDKTVYFGDTVEIGDYEIRYRSEQGQASLTAGRWTGTSFLILKELEGTELYEKEGDRMNLSDELAVTILESGYDDTGRFMEMKIEAPEDVFSSGEISSSTPENLMISQGESAQIPLTIENTGFLNQSYDLRAETNSSLTVSYSFQDFNVSDVYVPAGEQNSLTATVEVSETAQPGRYTLALVANSSETTLRENFQVEVRGAEVEKDISLDVEESYSQTTAGGTIEVPLTVRNGASMGYIHPGMDEGPVLENVEFEVEVPEGWDYQLNPGGYSELASRDIERSMLTVEVPENAETGDYFIDVSVSSEDTSLEEPVQIRANVREQSEMGVVGLILMAVSLGLLIFVYRKFGRR